MSKRVSAETHDVENTAEQSGAAVPLPGPKPMAQGDAYPGGTVPEDRDSIPAVGPAYVAPPNPKPGVGSRG